jgi:mono/diheme cytochrome c family protein
MLSGEEVEADLLNYGQEQYILYCYACHGAQGDGRGPASRWLRPPPRDFRLATFKFAKILGGKVPPDSELKRIITGGLKGTAMLEWDLSDSTLHAIVQFIKTFSPEGEGFREPLDEDDEIDMGEPVVPEEDPWADDPAGGVSYGKKAYHALGCWSCHPSFASKHEIVAASRELKGEKTVVAYRPNMLHPETKPSKIYTAPIKDFYTSHFRRDEEYDDCDSDENEGCEEGEKCVFGRCEYMLRIKPPDFTFDSVRSGSEPVDLYKTIRAGIPGTAMAEFEEDAKDLWAIAHYVNWLVSLKDTTDAVALKEALRKANAEFDATAPKAEEAPKEETPKAEEPEKSDAGEKAEETNAVEGTEAAQDGNKAEEAPKDSAE